MPEIFRVAASPVSVCIVAYLLLFSEPLPFSFSVVQFNFPILASISRAFAASPTATTCKRPGRCTSACFCTSCAVTDRNLLR